MICVIRKPGETPPGTATVTPARDDMTLVIKNVPALIRGNCGEQYLDEQTRTRLLATAQEATMAGVLVDVRSFVAA
ncbi:MAG: type II toxin-antitoxin system MqsA family antitoxin [Chloroflexota bacterium]